MNETKRNPPRDVGRLSEGGHVDRQVAQTMSRVARAQVPDLPDRIIAATALHLAIPIISRDRKIQASGLTTVW